MKLCFKSFNKISRICDIHNTYFALHISSHILHVYYFKLKIAKTGITLFYVRINLYHGSSTHYFGMFALWKYYLLFHNLFNFFLFTTGADTLAKNLHKSYIEQTAFYNFCCYNMPLKHSTMLKLPNSVLKISNNCSDNTSVRAS